jgi:hypothetical protein
MENLCIVENGNHLHIYPSLLLDLQGYEDENQRNSDVINYILTNIDDVLSDYGTINFHVHTGSMKISHTSKYKTVVSLFIQIVTVKYSTTMLDKCYLYDVNRAMKLILELIQPALPKVVKTKMIVVKEASDDDKED